MVKGCRNTCVKYLFFFSNFLTCIFGGFFFFFMIWFAVDDNFSVRMENMIELISHRPDLKGLSEYQDTLWIFTAIFGILFLVGFLGCCGAACESTVLLCLFIIVVIVCTICQGAIGVVAFTNKDGLSEVLTKCGEEPGCRAQLKPFELSLKCCVAPAEDCRLGPKCEDVVKDHLQNYGHFVLIVVLIMCTINVIALICACVIVRASRKAKYSVNKGKEESP